MRHGRHARPARLSRIAAAAGAVALTGAWPAHHAAAAPQPRLSLLSQERPLLPQAAAAPVQARGRAALPRYTVRSGDYLSSIAGRSCGDAADWTGLYAGNKSTIGADPNLILPGQSLALDCRQAAAPVTPPAPSSSPGTDGDGDHDSDDGTSQAPQSPPPPSGGTVTVTVNVSGADPSGQLTRDQVGALWLNAGGPAWAEWQAEQVAYCESGWNTNAYNPSGASGLWQILGEVVPGNVFDAQVNAANAVSKFKASGDTWAQWVCRP